jgi:hypothetical protein
MATWTNVSNTVLEPGDPIRSVDIIAIKENVIALSEGASGAPKIQSAAIGFPYVTTLNGETGAITNTNLNAIGSWVGSSKRVDQAVGTTVAGSTLTYAYWNGSSWSQPSLGLSGTWRFVGGVRHASADSVNDCQSIWVRVS